MIKRKLKDLLRKSRDKFFNSFDDSPKPILSIEYKGFDVYYSEGTSLIERIKKTGDYEPAVTACILNELQSNVAPVMMDIGANIGLISLGVLSQQNKATIYAFEPGPNQNQLLKKTIEKNELSEKIVLSDIALTNKKGKAKFRIHASADASGDGFLDTERAGPTKTIQVKTDTIDNWWIEMKKPVIDFIKMDTEGSEFYILQGAQELISSLKPSIILEINLTNLKKYPFSCDDLFELIDTLHYEVYSLEKDKISNSNRQKYMEREDTFLLLPKT